MRIRTKILILLLGISILPILLLRVLAQRAVTGLGQELAASSGALAAQKTQELMSILVQDHARILARDRQLLESAALLLSLESVKVLEKSEADKELKLYFDKDFDDNLSLIPGLTQSEDYLLHQRGGQDTPLPISFETQVQRLAPGLSPREAALSLLRLGGMDRVFREIHKRFGQRVHWQMLALADGVSSSYPGHGNFPRGFDARQSAWYEKARQQNGLAWIPLSLDPATRQPHLTVSAPLIASDGRFLGVCAILTTLEGVLQKNSHTNHISQNLESFLVRANRKPDGTQGLEIEAREDLPGRTPERALPGMGMGMGRAWKTPLEPDWLNSRDPEQFSQLLNDVQNNVNGSKILEYAGRPSLWAYASTAEPGQALLMLAPLSDVLEESQKISASVQQGVRQLQYTNAMILACMLVFIVLAALKVSRMLSQPLIELFKAAGRLAAGELNVRVEPRGNDEISELCKSFNDMAPKLAQNLRMSEALALASQIQHDLLPARALQAPGFEIAGLSRYCDETGGDYYDFLELSPDKLGVYGIVLADVSGHGLGAALLMTTARAFLRQRAATPAGQGR